VLICAMGFNALINFYLRQSCTLYTSAYRFFNTLTITNLLPRGDGGIAIRHVCLLVPSFVGVRVCSLVRISPPAALHGGSR